MWLVTGRDIILIFLATLVRVIILLLFITGHVTTGGTMLTDISLRSCLDRESLVTKNVIN